MEWIANWQDTFVGGAIVVGVVIFLMGLLKTVLFNRITNKLFRKIILSFFSLILVFPVTIGMMWYKGFDMSHIWIFYAINAVATVLIYWLYENTGLRNLLSLIGRNTVLRLITALTKSEKTISAVKNTIKDTLSEIEKDTQGYLEELKYKEDDLNNL